MFKCTGFVKDNWVISLVLDTEVWGFGFKLDWEFPTAPDYSFQFGPVGLYVESTIDDWEQWKRTWQNGVESRRRREWLPSGVPYVMLGTFLLGCIFGKILTRKGSKR